MITIDAARRDDVPLLLSLIRELAEFEKLAHEVVANEAQVERALFGPRAVAEAVIARITGEPAGFALFYHSFSTFVARAGLYLEDLYVRPDHRGQGVGHALLAHLARLATSRECGRLEWAVLDWNKRAIEFYEAIGAKPVGGWTVYRVTGDALDRLAKDASP
jgi:GNAT superfamily N-acetyltransferase